MPIPERPQALQRQSAKSVVYQTVCDWIITGVMKPGEKILDSELASYFNVSRTPVREALQLLQNQKLVCVIPGRTTVVADLDVEDFEKCYRPLAEIDALAAELACRNLTDAMLEELEQELQASAEANIKGDTAAIITHDTRFHELIIDAADNDLAHAGPAYPAHPLSFFPPADYAAHLRLPAPGDPGRPAGKGRAAGQDAHARALAHVDERQSQGYDGKLAAGQGLRPGRNGILNM